MNYPLTTGLHTAIATRQGTREYNMDAAAVFETRGGVVTAAIVDGIGNNRRGGEIMQLLAHAAVRIGAAKGALAGVLTAAALIEKPGVGKYQPNGVIVLALAKPGTPTHLAWIGDSHAYSWDGTKLQQRTDPHTMGAFLRQNGDLNLAPHHDNWVRLSLRNATPTTVAFTQSPADELVLLLSDGLDNVPLEELEALTAKHYDDPQMLADMLVATATTDHKDYRDDTTAVVIAPMMTDS